MPALRWQRLRDQACSFDIATASFAQAPVLSPVVFWRMAPLSDAGTPRSTSPEGFAYVPDRGASGLYSAQAQVVYPHIIQYWLDQDEGRGARSTLPTSQQWPEAFAYVANRGASGRYSDQAQFIYTHIIQYWLDQDEARGVSGSSGRRSEHVVQYWRDRDEGPRMAPG